MDFVTANYRFAYLLTYMAKQTRKPRTVFVQDMTQISIKRITRQDVKLAVKAEWIGSGESPLKVLFEQFSFEGTLLGGVTRRCPETISGLPISLGEFKDRAANLISSRMLLSDTLDSRHSWVAGGDNAVLDELPLNASNILESRREAIVDEIRHASNQCVFIDNFLYAPRPAAILHLDRSDDYLENDESIEYINNFCVWNGKHPDRLSWPIINFEHWETAQQLWVDSGKAERGIKELKLYELDRSLAPPQSEPLLNAQVAARRGLRDLGPCIRRIPSAGVAALARFSAALESGVIDPTEILADSQGLVHEWLPSPRKDQGRQWQDEKPLANFRFCTEALASSKELYPVPVPDDGLDMLRL